MWLSQRHRETGRHGEDGLGIVTLEGNPAAVYLAGERRNLPVLAPGGYAWVPAAGDQVLVLKTGADGEAPCVVAALEKERELPPGAVQLFNREETATITLDEEGNIRMTGRVFVNGMQIGPSPPEEEDEEDEEEEGTGEGSGEGTEEGTGEGENA